MHYIFTISGLFIPGIVRRLFWCDNCVCYTLYNPVIKCINYPNYQSLHDKIVHQHQIKYTCNIFNSRHKNWPQRHKNKRLAKIRNWQTIGTNKQLVQQLAQQSHNQWFITLFCCIVHLLVYACYRRFFRYVYVYNYVSSYKSIHYLFSIHQLNTNIIRSTYNISFIISNNWNSGSRIR